MSDQRWTFSWRMADDSWQGSSKRWDTRRGAIDGATEWVSACLDNDATVTVKVHKALGFGA